MQTESQVATGDTEKPAEDTTVAPETEVSTEQQDVKAESAEAEKAEGEKAEDKKAEGKKEETPDYEFQAPEGVEVDSEVVGAFGAWAKENDIPQDKAQALVDKIAPLMAQRQEAFLETTSEQWVSQARADKEFGGDKFDENLAVAQKAMKAYGSDELRRLLNVTKLGNHPEVLRTFYKIGKEIKVDSDLPGGKPAGEGPQSPEKVLYPNMA